MGDEIEKIAATLPEVQFDWYARLIPGSLGVFLYLWESGQLQLDASLTATQVLTFLFAGYVVGHILQPVPGLIVKRLEQKWSGLCNQATANPHAITLPRRTTLWGWNSNTDLEGIYARAKRDKETPARSISKVTKAHSEANSMMGCAIAALLITVFYFNWYLVALVAYFIAASLQRVAARARKIADLEEKPTADKAAGD